MFLNKGVVPKHYLTNPSTERLITKGSQLENGMVVLREESSVKADTSKFDTETDQETLAQAYRWNRWMRIHELVVDHTISSVIFVGEFGDGSRMMFNTSINCPWFVKLNNDDFWDAQYDQDMKDCIAATKSIVETPPATDEVDPGAHSS